MPYYRISLINGPDRIVDFHDLVRNADDDALATATTFLTNWPVVQVWNGTRLVAKLAGQKAT
jgi:hypothetical protein